MTEPRRDHEQRISHLEERVEEVAHDAEAARHLPAAGDRDLADLGIKVDAHRQAINALGLRVADLDRRVDQRFGALETRVGTLETSVDAGFAETAQGFAEMRGRFDQTAAGQAQVVGLLTRLIDDEPRKG